MINTAPLTGKTPIDPNTLGPSGEGTTTHVVHDLGCSEPCTCGAWDRAVRIGFLGAPGTQGPNPVVMRGGSYEIVDDESSP